MSIQIQELVKRYGQQTAVDHLTFEAKPGEIVGFLGPNGAGKSSTMKILCGFLPADAGTVQVAGVNVLQNALEAKRHIGYLPEHNPLYLDLYVREYLRFAGHLRGLAGNTLERAVADAIERVGLGPEAHKKLGSLSKGYRQRAGIAQALLHNPSVLVLDEPTSGLDPNQVVEIRNLIRELGRDKTLLFSSHIMQEVQAVADKVVIINKGKLVLESSLANLQQELGAAVLLCEFEKPGFDFGPIQEKLGITQVEAIDATTFRLTVPAGVDIRKGLFEAAVQQNNALLQTERSQANLEAVFRQLTNPE